VIRKRAIATVCMPGTLADKLSAAAEAGYQGIEIFENDLTYFDGRPEDVRGLAGSLGLEIVALQPTRRLIARRLDALQALLAALADRDQLGLDLAAALDREADGVGARASGHRSACVLRWDACEKGAIEGAHQDGTFSEPESSAGQPHSCLFSRNAPPRQLSVPLFQARTAQRNQRQTYRCILRPGILVWRPPNCDETAIQDQQNEKRRR
jgi:hypothetical protein